MPDLAYVCPRCGEPALAGRFCQSCSLYLGDRSGRAQAVTQTRRFLGDYVLEGLLMIATLFLGWLVWLVFTARRGQTPAKRLLNIYVLDSNSGEPVRGTRLLGRELAVKVVGINLANTRARSRAGRPGRWAARYPDCLTRKPALARRRSFRLL